MYVGTAVSGDREMSIFSRPLKGSLHHGLILAGYIVPFIFTGLYLELC